MRRSRGRDLEPEVAGGADARTLAAGTPSQAGCRLRSGSTSCRRGSSPSLAPAVLAGVDVPYPNRSHRLDRAPGTIRTRPRPGSLPPTALARRRPGAGWGPIAGIASAETRRGRRRTSRHQRLTRRRGSPAGPSIVRPRLPAAPTPPPDRRPAPSQATAARTPHRAGDVRGGPSLARTRQADRRTARTPPAPVSRQQVLGLIRGPRSRSQLPEADATPGPGDPVQYWLPRAERPVAEA